MDLRAPEMCLAAPYSLHCIYSEALLTLQCSDSWPIVLNTTIESTRNVPQTIGYRSFGRCHESGPLLCCSIVFEKACHHLLQIALIGDIDIGTLVLREQTNKDTKQEAIVPSSLPTAQKYTCGLTGLHHPTYMSCKYARNVNFLLQL